MAIEDVLNRIAAGGWPKVIERSELEIPIPSATVVTPGTLGSDLAPVENLAVAKDWALRVSSDESMRAIRYRFRGDIEPAAGKRYRLIREPDAPWVDRCPQGHLVDDHLWLRQCVGIVCIECKAVYDPSECQTVLRPTDRTVGEPAEGKQRKPGGSSRSNAQNASSPTESPEKS
jgi:hypothetical protein